MKNDVWICALTLRGAPMRGIASLAKGASAFFLAVFFITAAAFAQGSPAAKPGESVVSTTAEGGTVQEKDLTLYGEVQAVNPASNTISVQYYNYDTDEEKTMEVMFDKDTKVENAAGPADIKKGDWVDVTYAASGGKNIAGSVIVEKEEAIVEESINPPASEALEPGVE